MPVRIKGLNNFRRQIEELKQKTESVSGQVPVEEVLSPEFMARHTNFTSSSEMVEASGHKPETQEDWDAILASEGWNNYVVSNTLFSGWDAMLSAAGVECFKERLGLE